MRICFANVLQKYIGVSELFYICKEETTIQHIVDYIEQGMKTDMLKFTCTYLILINGKRIARMNDLVNDDDELTVIPVIQGG